ncbi:MAG: hypothetical protein LBT39_05955, partial [Treponema sp.]|nr:hypothetical protein [Treponema sp.]
MDLQNKAGIDNETERLLVNHCSLVLFGGKPSALFTVRTEQCYACLLDTISKIDTSVSSTILRKTQN